MVSAHQRRSSCLPQAADLPTEGAQCALSTKANGPSRAPKKQGRFPHSVKGGAMSATQSPHSLSGGLAIGITASLLLAHETGGSTRNRIRGAVRRAGDGLKRRA